MKLVSILSLKAGHTKANAYILAFVFKVPDSVYVKESDVQMAIKLSKFYLTVENSGVKFVSTKLTWNTTADIHVHVSYKKWFLFHN